MREVTVTPVRDRLNERLLDQYRAQPRICPCACGGTVEAPLNDHRMIELAIEWHQATPRHVRWRASRETVD